MESVINNINACLILYLATILWSFSHELFFSRELNDKGKGPQALLGSLITNLTRRNFELWIKVRLGSQCNSVDKLKSLEASTDAVHLTLGKWSCQYQDWAGHVGEIMTGNNVRDLLQRAFHCSLKMSSSLQYHQQLCASMPVKKIYINVLWKMKWWPSAEC